MMEKIKYFLDAWAMNGIGQTIATVQDSPGTVVDITVDDLRALLSESKPAQSYCDLHCKRMCQNSTHGVCDGPPAAPAQTQALTPSEWAPDRIWLQRGIGEGGSHTWCEDSQDEHEQAEYVRVAMLPASGGDDDEG